MVEYFLIKLYWDISFINLHKNLKKKKSGFDTDTQKPEK